MSVDRLDALGAFTRRVAALVSLLMIPGVACGGGDEGTDSDTSVDTGAVEPQYTWWRDVEPVVRRRCMNCHQEGGIAPFSLERYEDFVSLGSFLGQAIESGEMPPWPPDGECRDYSHSLALEPAEEQLLLGYLAGELAEGDPANAPVDDAPPEPELAPDFVVEMPESYTPADVVDDYRCFLIPLPDEITDTSYIVASDVFPGETRIVHHVITYAVAPENVAPYELRDAEDPGPGYTCFGGPGPTDGSARWLSGWVPGQVPFFAPPGVGQELTPGTTLIMQVHYHPIGVELADRSSFGFELAPSVERRGEIVPLAELAWLQGDGAMLIPAGEPEVVHEVTATHSHPIFLNALLRMGLPGDADLELINVGSHMHLFGKSARVELRDPSRDTAECLLDIPRWDFNWQSSYEFAERPLFRAGMEINVRCEWDNSAENQPVVDGQPIEPADRDWGDGTLDEMCLGILFVTEPSPQ